MSDTVTASGPVRVMQIRYLDPDQGMDVVTSFSSSYVDDLPTAGASKILKCSAVAGAVISIVGFIWSLLSLSVLPAVVLLLGITIFLVSGIMGRRSDWRYRNRQRNEWRMV